MNNTSSTSSSPKQPSESESSDTADGIKLLVHPSPEDIFAILEWREMAVGLIPNHPQAIRMAGILSSSMDNIELLYRTMDVLNEEQEKGADFNDAVVDLGNDIAKHLNTIFARTHELSAKHAPNALDASQGLAN